MPHKQGLLGWHCLWKTCFWSLLTLHVSSIHTSVSPTYLFMSFIFDWRHLNRPASIFLFLVCMWNGWESLQPPWGRICVEQRGEELLIASAGLWCNNLLMRTLFDFLLNKLLVLLHWVRAFPTLFNKCIMTLLLPTLPFTSKIPFSLPIGWGITYLLTCIIFNHQLLLHIRFQLWQ